MVKVSVKDYLYLIGSTHFDDKGGLWNVSLRIYAGRSPVGEVILICRAPIHSIGLVSSRADITQVMWKILYV